MPTEKKCARYSFSAFLIAWDYSENNIYSSHLRVWSKISSEFGETSISYITAVFTASGDGDEILKVLSMLAKGAFFCYNVATILLGEDIIKSSE